MPTSQFGTPRGVRGWIAARVVARLTGEANRWMVECLDVGRDDSVLDVGCGPGLALRYAAQATDGAVLGVDPSDAMTRLARRRLQGLIEAGHVRILRADAARLPLADGCITRAGSLNSMQFWPSPEQGLAELYRVIRPGGRVAVILMARSNDPVHGAASWVEMEADRLRTAGFVDVHHISRTFGGVPHWALLAQRSEDEVGALLNPTADGVRKDAAP